MSIPPSRSAAWFTNPAQPSALDMSQAIPTALTPLAPIAAAALSSCSWPRAEIATSQPSSASASAAA